MFVTNFDLWGRVVLEQFNQWAFVDILLDSKYNAETREVHLSVALNSQKALENSKLLVWMIEDNVIAQQNDDPNYLHHHIFRVSVNGTWGESINNETQTFDYRYTLNEILKTEDISMVALVYNADTDAVYGVNERLLLK